MAFDFGGVRRRSIDFIKSLNVNNILDRKDLRNFLLKVSFLVVLIAETAAWYVTDTTFFHYVKIFNPWFLTGMLLIFTCVSLLYSVFNNLLVSILFTVTFAASLLIAHVLKFIFLGTPVFFWDYVLIKDGLIVLPQLIGWFSLFLYGFLIALGFSLLAYLCVRIEKIRFPFKDRLAVSAVATGLVLVTFFIFKIPYERAFPANSFRDSRVVKTGIYPFLALTFRYSGAAPVPEGYGESAIREIVGKYPPEKQSGSPLSGEEAPNLIFYVLESFMDPDMIGARYKTDPIPFFRSLENKTGKGVLISPTYGGKTVQPEFELLTGLSQYKMNSPNPYVYINSSLEPFPTLCRALKKAGYYCLGLNGGKADAFQRDRTYPRMEFDRFIAMKTEYDPENMEMIHGRVSDRHLVGEFIKQYSKIASVGKPIFSYIMTKSTHAVYDLWEKKDKYEVLNEGLPAKTEDALHRYASAINQADKAVEKLVRYFEKQERKTIIFVYGDHKPGLGSVFEDLKIYADESRGKKTKFETPLRIWANFELPKKDRLVSSNLLIGIIDGFLNIKAHLPIQLRIARKLSDEFDVVSKFLVDKKGNYYDRENLPEAIKNKIRDYELVQYDLLQGKKFVLRYE